MNELFRYIEQSFVVPPANVNAIDVSGSSDFQNKLRSDLQQEENVPLKLRKDAQDFIDKYVNETENPLSLGQQYLTFHDQLRTLTSDKKEGFNNLIEEIFNSSSEKLVSSDAFKKDKQLLNDLLIAVKIVTGFDKVRTNDLVAMRQAIALLEVTTGRNYQTPSEEEIKASLFRPIVVPSAFLKTPPQQMPPPPVLTGDSDEVKKLKALKKEYDSLKAAYVILISLRPDELQMIEVPGTEKPVLATANTKKPSSQKLKSLTEIPRQVLALTDAALRKLEPSVLKMFESESLDIKTTGYSELAKTIGYKTKNLYALLNPCDQVRAVTKIYRLGINAFAINTGATILSTSSAKSPDFSHAITRPVGIGNLQVVRQELLGYEAKEISHIENILEGEILRHSTRRSDTSEVTITEETQTTQTDERDLQSTIRNELVSETQKEAGQQSSSAKDQTSTTSYGKLVENSKSSYAKTVTDRAVSSLSQQVKHQRIQREKKSFIEKSMHEFDNSKTGAKNVTGIYQWVDKKYKTRIINYGTRLLYDVVVPEPAAFLIEALKNAPQPEGLELIKPDVFDMCPSCLDTDNYACLAAKYGATGAVTPPPDDFLLTKQLVDSSIDGPKKVEGFGNVADGFFFKGFTINIPENYKAVNGYVQMVTPHLYEFEKIHLEFNIAENYYLFFETPRLYSSFKMKSETGDIPVTFRSFGGIYQYSFAIGIYCQRTDKLLELWQLKTHAAIMNGYNRQLADYQGKLAKFQAIIRAQMAQAANYAHNPSIEQGELKKAFIYLLLGEHFGQAYIPTPNPALLPPDPIYIKKWGAMVAFFERAFEWENIMFTYYPYFWGRTARWGELILIQDINPEFEEFLKAGAARVVVPVRPGYEAALAHYQETGDIWMGEEMPDMFSDLYVSIIQEIKARNFAPGDEICIAEWDVNLPTTLVMLKDDAILPKWEPSMKCMPIG